MLPSLVRLKFVDRNWDPATLDRLAEFWLQLFDVAERPFKPFSSHRLPVTDSRQALELRLIGFTRSTARGVSDELVQRLRGSGVDAEVSAADPDTLVAKTKWRAGDQQPFAGLGTHALVSAPFDGMFVEIRYTVADTRAAGRLARRS